MVKRTWQGMGLALVCLLSLPAAAALHVELDSQTPRYGQPVRLTVSTDLREPDLRNLELDALREHFVIESVAHERAASGMQTLRVSLNPRRSGEVSLPALWFAGQRSAPQRIMVAAAEDAGAPIQVTWSLSHPQVWQRQQVLVRVQVQSRARFFQVQAEPFQSPRATVVPLDTAATKSSDDGNEYTERTAGWALFPSVPGRLTIDLPALQYVRGGRVQYRFAPPSWSLPVRPLPPYVPPDLPVGAVSMHSRIVSPPLLDTDVLAFWEVQVRGHGLPAAALPSPLAPVRGDARVNFLPAQEASNQQADVTGLTAVRSYRIPFTARRSGAVKLPGLEVQYFDPDSGRLVRAGVASEKRWVLAGYWRLALAALLLGGGWYAGRQALRVVRAHALRRRQWRQTLQDLAEAEQARQVRQVLYRFGNQQGWRLDGSLQSWASAFRHRHRHVDPHLDSILAQLNRSEFSGRDGPAPAPLRHALCQTLRRARRRRGNARSEPVNRPGSKAGQ